MLKIILIQIQMLVVAELFRLFTLFFESSQNYSVELF